MRLALAAGFALPAAAPDVPEGAVYRYACEGGASVAAAYINPPDGDSYAVVLHDGSLIPMKAGPTGSGVRYVSLDGTGLVWHVKGDAGFLAHDADMSMIAEGCSEVGG